MTPPAVFFATHADDDMLSMGSAIRHHLEAGRDVHSVLMTNGVTSGAREIIGLSRTAFIRARDGEFYRAMLRVGVRPDHIHISGLRTPSDSLTVDSATDVIMDFLDRYPGADVKTYSQLPGGTGANARHQDHVNSGQAAVNLLAAGELASLRLYLEPWLLDNWKAANPAVSVSSEKATGVTIVQAALDEYAAKDSAGGKYGIGPISVPGPFKLVRADPTCWYHLPPS